MFDTITRDTFKTAQVVTPPPELAAAFEASIGTALTKVRAVAVQNLTLAAVRDVLLPKLMSGELRVKDAERIRELT